MRRDKILKFLCLAFFCLYACYLILSTNVSPNKAL